MAGEEAFAVLMAFVFSCCGLTLFSCCCYARRLLISEAPIPSAPPQQQEQQQSQDALSVYEVISEDEPTSF